MFDVGNMAWVASRLVFRQVPSTPCLIFIGTVLCLDSTCLRVGALQSLPSPERLAAARHDGGDARQVRAGAVPDGQELPPLSVRFPFLCRSVPLPFHSALFSPFDVFLFRRKSIANIHLRAPGKKRCGWLKKKVTHKSELQAKKNRHSITSRCGVTVGGWGVLYGTVGVAIYSTLPGHPAAFPIPNTFFFPS